MLGVFLRIILLCYFISDFSTYAEIVHQDNKTELLWCRRCGMSVGDSSFLFNKLSPGTLKSEYRTLFGRNITVQRLINPFLFMFDVVTTKQASCHDFGRNTRGDSWFPGYTWRVCTCHGCGAQLGWTFERTLSNDLEDTNQNETFHALMVEMLYDKSGVPQIKSLTTPMPLSNESSNTSLSNSSISDDKFQPRAVEDPPVSLTNVTISNDKVTNTTIKEEEKIVTTLADNVANITDIITTV